MDTRETYGRIGACIVLFLLFLFVTWTLALIATIFTTILSQSH